jgi:hypothetical protein
MLNRFPAILPFCGPRVSLPAGRRLLHGWASIFRPLIPAILTPPARLLPTLYRRRAANSGFRGCDLIVRERCLLNSPQDYVRIVKREDFRHKSALFPIGILSSVSRGVVLGMAKIASSVSASNRLVALQCPDGPADVSRSPFPTPRSNYDYVSTMKLRNVS